MAFRQGILVAIEEGMLQGTTALDLSGKKYYSFKGIPYGEAPVGKLRFKAPLPVQPWYGVKKALAFGPVSPRKPAAPHMSEDCLHLNVFTPQLPKINTISRSIKPVIVFIHGGQNKSGNPADFGPENLMRKDVILVTVSYRLHILGFLNCKDPALDIPGNAALKDVQLALKWVQRNIEQFGGDRNNVALYGTSTGAHIADVLGLAPTCTGLFHKVILSSGSSLMQKKMKNPSPIDLARLIEPSATIDSEQEAVDILLAADPLDIWDAKEKLPSEVGPVLEAASPNSILTERCLDVLRSGKPGDIPYLMGVCQVEGVTVAYPVARGLQEMPRKTSDFQDLIPPHCSFPCSKEHLAARIEEFAYGNNNIAQNHTEWEMYQKYLSLSGDIIITIPLLKMLRLRLARIQSPIYFYKFDLVTKMNYLRNRRNITEFEGACHADDLGYAFTIAGQPKVEKGSEEDYGIVCFTTILANFVKTGNPNLPDCLGVDWPRLDESDMKHLVIEKELRVESMSGLLERLAFWDALDVSFGAAGQH